MRRILARHAHRPWPLPRRPWVLAQTWADLLFMHWPLPPEALAPHVPPGLALETFDGTAWLGIVPLRMAWVRPRALPPVPGPSFFPELNVRTYVRHGDVAGVWFLSLDAASRIAVRVARRLFHLPYFDAAMRVEREGDGVCYRSERTHAGAPPAGFEAAYGPDGDVAHAEEGTLAHFLTERYCLFAADDEGGLWRADVHHVPWPLQPAVCTVRTNAMAACHGVALPSEAPLLHFARSVTVATWAPRRISEDRPTSA